MKGKAQRHQDPATGDELTRGEYISWIIQGVIRRWTVLGIIFVATIVCWATRDATVLLWWNLSASLLAIMIEFIVGLAMFGQTKRDALVIREVRTISQRDAQTLASIEKQDAAMLALLAKMEAQEALMVQLLQSRGN